MSAAFSVADTPMSMQLFDAFLHHEFVHMFHWGDRDLIFSTLTFSFSIVQSSTPTHLSLLHELSKINLNRYKWEIRVRVPIWVVNRKLPTSCYLLSQHKHLSYHLSHWGSIIIDLELETPLRLYRVGDVFFEGWTWRACRHTTIALPF